MASNSPSSNCDEEKLEPKRHDIELGFTMANPTSEELDERREQQIQALPDPENSTRPKTESRKLPSGDVKETVLIYNSKTEHDSKPYKRYKTRWCDHRNNPEGCEKGGDCTFAHDETEKKFYTSLWNTYYDEANIKKAHHEPCRNQQCPIRLRSLLYKTVICKNWDKGCSYDPCNFAHGDGELKPLPKYEMCKNFQRRTCNLKSSECVYAHGKHEKRQKGATIIQKSAAAAAELCTNCQWLHHALPDEDLRNTFIV